MVRPTYSTPSDSTEQQTNFQRYMEREDRSHQKNSATLIKCYQDPYIQSSFERGKTTIHTKTTPSNKKTHNNKTPDYKTIRYHHPTY